MIMGLSRTYRINLAAVGIIASSAASLLSGAAQADTRDDPQHKKPAIQYIAPKRQPGRVAPRPQIHHESVKRPQHDDPPPRHKAAEPQEKKVHREVAKPQHDDLPPRRKVVEPDEHKAPKHVEPKMGISEKPASPIQKDARPSVKSSAPAMTQSDAAKRLEAMRKQQQASPQTGNNSVLKAGRADPKPAAQQPTVLAKRPSTQPSMTQSDAAKRVETFRNKNQANSNNATNSRVKSAVQSPGGTRKPATDVMAKSVTVKPGTASPYANNPIASKAWQPTGAVASSAVNKSIANNFRGTKLGKPNQLGGYTANSFVSHKAVSLAPAIGQCMPPPTPNMPYPSTTKFGPHINTYVWTRLIDLFAGGCGRLVIPGPAYAYVVNYSCQSEFIEVGSAPIRSDGYVEYEGHTYSSDVSYWLDEPASSGRSRAAGSDVSPAVSGPPPASAAESPGPTATAAKAKVEKVLEAKVVEPESARVTLGTVGVGAFEACSAATAVSPNNSAKSDDTTNGTAAADENQPSRSPQLMLETGGHLAQIRSLVFTPGGKCLISAGDDKVVRIWSLDSGRSERTLRGEIELGPKGTVLAVALSPDGATLAASGSMEVPEQGGHAIRLYDLTTGEIAGLLVGHTQAVSSLAFSSDGLRLLSGSADKDAIIWDVAGRRPLQVLSGHDESVTAVAFSPDGNRAVTASADRTARLWTVADGKLIKALEGHEAPLSALAVFARDGAIATASLDGDIKLWNGESGEFAKTLPHLEFSPGALAAGPDGDALVVTCGDRCRRNFEQHVLSRSSGKPIASYRGHDGFVFAAAVHSDGTVATAGGLGHEIHLWKLDTGTIQQVLKGTGSGVSTVGFFPDSRSLGWSHRFDEKSHLVRGAIEAAIDLPDEATHLGQPIRVEADAVSSFVHAEDHAGEWSINHATAGGEEVAGGGRKGGKGGGGGGGGGSTGPGAANVTISQKDEVVATIGPDKRLGKGFAYRAYAFAASGQEVLVGGDQGLLAAYNLKAERTTTFVGHDSTVWSVSPSPDGRLIASGGSDQTVKLWNIETGELIATLFQSTNGEWVMWTPQGYYTGSAGGGELVGWQVNRGPDKAADYVRGQQLREVLNRPDIVERAITLASATAAIGELAPNSPTVEQILSVGLPPVVAMLDGLNGQTTVTGGRGTIVVGLKENPLPMEALDIWVNDRKVTGQSVDLPATLKREPGIDYKAFEIPLFANENLVRISATNEIGSSDQSEGGRLSIKITHNGEGALDKRGTLFVLAVGVDKYPGLPGKDLNLAVSDADGFMSTAQKEMKTSHDRVVPILLVNGKGKDQDPTRTNIEAALKRLEKDVTANDTVALFFAGHGSNQGGTFYFLPTDVADAQHGGTDTYLDWGVVQKSISRISGRKVLFLDACQAADSYYQRLQEDARVSLFVAFAAATGNQSAVEMPELHHGVFTYAVIKGLEGEAEDKAARTVMVYGLGNYVTTEVSKRTVGRQTPEYFPTPGANFVLVKH